MLRDILDWNLCRRFRQNPNPQFMNGGSFSAGNVHWTVDVFAKARLNQSIKHKSDPNEVHYLLATIDRQGFPLEGIFDKQGDYPVPVAWSVNIGQTQND